MNLYNLYLENKTIVPGILSLITTTVGFYIGYKSRKKKMPNERISTLKDINSIFDEVEDVEHLQLVVKKQMKSAILQELSGLKDENLALLFTRIDSATSLSNRQRHSLRKFIKNVDLEYNKAESTKDKDFYAVKIEKNKMRFRSFILFPALYIAGCLSAFFFEMIAINASLRNDNAVAWFMILIILFAIIFMAYQIHKFPNPSDYISLKNAFNNKNYSHPFNNEKIEAINKRLKSKNPKVNSQSTVGP